MLVILNVAYSTQHLRQVEWDHPDSDILWISDVGFIYSPPGVGVDGLCWHVVKRNHDGILELVYLFEQHI